MMSSPLKSKKLISAQIFNLCWVILLILSIKANIGDNVLLSMVYCLGMVQGLYLGGQSFVDSILKAKFSGTATNEKEETEQEKSI